jgi:hypothetical protein
VTTFFRSGSTCEGVRSLLLPTVPEYSTLHVYYTLAIVVLVLVLVCTITVNPRRTSARNIIQHRLTPSFGSRSYCGVQRIGGLTLADPIYVLEYILRRAYEIMMVVMTIKTNDEYQATIRGIELEAGLATAP